MNELPLVFFTVLSQSAVGAFVILLLAYALKQIDDRKLAVGLFVAMCIVGLGQLIGAFHLGQPFRAFNMLMGAGRSPMSNEIILSALFTTMGGIAALGLLLNRGYQRSLTILSYIAGVVGLVFILVIPTVYQLETVANWNNAFTTIQMLLTVAIGGGLLAASLGARLLGISVSSLAIGLSFVLRPGWMAALSETGSPLVGEQTGWLTVQLVLLALGLGAAIVALRREKVQQPMLYSAALLVVVAELTGRIAFYNLWAVPM